MTTAERILQLEIQVKELHQLVSLLIPIDTEGKYKDIFVKDIKKKRAEKSFSSYSGSGSLLTQIT